MEMDSHLQSSLLFVMKEFMINFNISTAIYRPIKQVFDYVSTPENDFQWQYGTLASARLLEGEIGLGMHFRSVGHLMGNRVQSVFEVNEYEPNAKYGFKSLSGPLLSQISYSFSIDRGSTKVGVCMQANGVNSIQIAEGVLEKWMRLQFKENLTMLKNLLEVKRVQFVAEANSMGKTNGEA